MSGHMFVSRRAVMRAGLAVGLSGAAAMNTQACEILVGGFRILHPWTRATEPGETSAPLCMTIDQVTEADRLVSVSTPVAEGAEMGGAAAGPVVDWPLPLGVESVFSEQGAHVRLVGLKLPLRVGRVYPLLLGFDKAGLVVATVSVDFGRFR
jgi:copper(I)-binding protein